MPDILGATNPVPGYDNANVNRNIPVSPNNTQIQNVPDPSRVSRADGRTEQQSGGEGSPVRYDSNFQTFLQRLRGTPGAAESLARIFSGREGTVVLSGMSAGIAEEMSPLRRGAVRPAAQRLCPGRVRRRPGGHSSVPQVLCGL